MSDRGQKVAYFLAAVAALAGAFYLIRTRKKRLPVVSTENYFKTRNASWFSFPKLLRTNSEDATDTQNHPDGPNIGFQSNPSWLTKDKSAAAKTDLLHTGHIKGGKLVVVMVGLPGRGKTYIARKVARYLRWISYRTRAFSLAKYRLDKLGSKSADFFDPTSTANYQQRVNLVRASLEDAIRYLNRGGEISILDGTNTTRDRRQIIRDRVASEDGYDILWIESVSQNDKISDRQLEELKNSPDFLDKEDYERRMAHYKSSYETLGEDEGSFIKVYDDGRKLTLHEIHGFLRTKIVSFVMNLHTVPRPIYIGRHGESVFNVRGLIGGDSCLTHRGVLFGRALNEYMTTEELGKEQRDHLNIWTSTMRSARQTSAEIKSTRVVEWRALREIETGVCDGLSYEQVKLNFPDEYRSRNQDKLRYRYPRGESYLDVINRLEPVIFEIERQQEPLLIIAHQAVLRCLYAYFLDLPSEEIPYLSIPLHTIIRLEARAYGCKEKRMRIVINDDGAANLRSASTES